MRKLSALFIIAVILIGTGVVLAVEIQDAPDFTLKDMNGSSLTLFSFKDKNPVLLFFWASWCPYCRNQIKNLNKMYPDLNNAGIKIFGVNLMESAAKVQKFAKSNGLKYPILLDTDGKVSDAYSVVGIPTYVLINKDDRIVFQDNYFPKDEYKSLILKD